MKIVIAIALLLYTAVGQICSLLIAQNIQQLTVTSTNSVYSASSYSPTSGLTMTASSATVGAINTVTISNWGISDDTVLRAELVTVSSVNTFQLNANSTSVAVRSRLSSAYVYFGFKASISNLSIDVTPTSANSVFTIQIKKFGWNNNQVCDLACSKTVYQYSSIGVAVPGQFNCYAIRITSFAVTLILLTFFL